ncbi:MAG TPA: multidrug ABC transporter substrate-binding protein [Bacteroidales bacterium]|nr:MAG: multidrug ABC transporter substrate-binding protein [Bacteroidetes bacterium GWE2_42_24]OFY28402.1 MAG: multidrug ABC transporter substrate-binding protein [Bacteroidetes bacterium GWF2_43_11]HAQ65358.1 multidrug ABC transporter substrate-binding protein [Bacteroidales bacterium]HBZ65472.1 multidrug ABC transporter substrate-binding protein [Bacteroidales bacterium]
MNIANLIRVALYALRRNKFRAFLTMLGIIIGVASVIAMLAIGQGSKQSIQNQISSMGSNMVIVMPASQQMGGVNQGGSSMQSLEVADALAIAKQCPSVLAVSPEVRSSGQVVYGSENWPTSFYGVDVGYLGIKKFQVSSGRMFNAQEVKTAAKVIVVGQTVVDNLFGKGVDPIGRSIRFRSIPLKIIGVLSEKGENTFGQDQDDLILGPYTTVQKRILAITHVQGIYASAASEALTTNASAEMTAALRQSHHLRDGEDDDFQIRTQQELVNTFSSISNVLTILLGAIAGISLLVGGIGIMNIMYVSVTERTREIGLRMSIGGRGIDILMQFLIESMLLSIIGGILGILVGIGSSKVIAIFTGWPVVVMPAAVILSFLVCTAIGIFFGWYPARKASGLNPIDALRYE